MEKSATVLQAPLIHETTTTKPSNKAMLRVAFAAAFLIESVTIRTFGTNTPVPFLCDSTSCATAEFSVVAAHGLLYPR